MSYQRTDLDNGIRVVTEDHPSSRAVACGIWIDSGTRDEKKSEQGISHFLEHMVFKGTKNRSAYDIVKDLEMVGAEVNAFTTKENTCFHTLSPRGSRLSRDFSEDRSRSRTRSDPPRIVFGGRFSGGIHF
jgi:predicted Zn-dependent peptidase